MKLNYLGCVRSLLLFGLFSSCVECRLLSGSSAQASQCDGSFRCKVQTLGHAGFSGSGSRVLQDSLNSCGAQAECSGARGILPDQGSSLCLPHWQADSLPLSHQGNHIQDSLIHCLWGRAWGEILRTHVDRWLRGSSSAFIPPN